MTKIYNRVVAITDITSMRKTFSPLKDNSPAEWETLSKPMKAQGEMTAILMICDKAFLSGINEGLNPTLFPERAATKTRMMPQLNTTANPVMMIWESLLPL